MMKKMFVGVMLGLFTMTVHADIVPMTETDLDQVSAQGLIIDSGTLDGGHLSNNPQVQQLNEMLHQLIQWRTLKDGEVVNQQIILSEQGYQINTIYHADSIKLDNFTLRADKDPWNIGAFQLKGVDLEIGMKISPK